MVTTGSNGFHTSETEPHSNFEPSTRMPARSTVWSLHDAFMGAGASVGVNVADTALHWFILAVGLIPILVVVSRGGGWGTEPTLGLLLSLFAVYQLLVNRGTKSRN